MSETKFPEIQGSQPNNGAGNDGMNEYANDAGSRGPSGSQMRGRSGQSYRSGRQSSQPVGKTAFVAKKERIEVEKDAQLLANRIALLKQEEMKTWKKIEETKKRAQEVMRLKNRNNERVQEKMEKMQYDNMVSQMTKQRINQMRKERNAEKAKIQQSILMSKHEEAKQSKIKMQQDNARKAHQMDYINRLNAERRQRIKFDEHIAKQKQEEIRRRKVADTRADIQRQIDEENRMIANKEQEVMQMELLEMELIKKLQNTQAVQKQAFVDLETAIQQRTMIGSGEMSAQGYRSQGQRFRGASSNDENNNMVSGDIGLGPTSQHQNLQQ